MSTIERLIRPAVVIASLAFVASCSSVPVQQDYDPGYDFSALSSYAWMERPPAGDAPDVNSSQLVDARVRKAFDQAMSSKGHRRTSPEQASFLVTHYIAVDQKIRVDTTSYGYGYGYRGYGGGGYTDTRVSQYDVGTLIIDFVSNDEDKKLIWRGTGTSRIQEKKTPDERQKVVTRVVDAIIDQFPPKTQK
jgi:hypothetical protein